ncbi:MAG TPA: hypothetical protein VL463_29830 [Kofleriaceae bacterium]|nr:hypothetical protein [Kofleriaceae bacterium]
MPENNDKDELPSATVVKDGKVPGDVPRTPPPPAKRAYKRRWSNYLLDKKLQLRYVLLVTILSALISGSLGYLVYQQEHRASDDIAASLAEQVKSDPATYGDLQKEAVADMKARDEALVLKMIGTGLGLAVILVLYLVVMTHKVAGPLYKVSNHFDQMAAGKLPKIWGLRKGDMLQDFFASFKEMYDANRARMTDDVAAMEKLVAACKAAGVAKSGDLSEELEALEAHVAARKQALS